MTDAAEEVESWKVELGQRLVAARTGFTQAELAARLGMSTKSIGFYERGIRPPDAGFLIRFQEVTGVNLHWLLTGQGGMRGRNVLTTQEWEEVGLSLREIIGRQDTSIERRASLLHNYLKNLLDARL